MSIYYFGGSFQLTYGEWLFASKLS